MALQFESSEFDVKAYLKEANFIDVDTAKELECNICYAPCDNARTTCKNNHRNCLDCLLKMQTRRQEGTDLLCPMCQDPVVFHSDGTPGIPDPLIDKMIGTLRVACPNERCKEICNVKGLYQHVEQTCQFSFVECPFAHLGCTHRMAKVDIAKHLDEEAIHHLNLNCQKSSAVEHRLEAANRMIEQQGRHIRSLYRKIDWESRQSARDRKGFAEALGGLQDSINRIMHHVVSVSEEEEHMRAASSGITPKPPRRVRKKPSPPSPPRRPHASEAPPPNSPGASVYSPTSPGYSPTSPVYNPPY